MNRIQYLFRLFISIYALILVVRFIIYLELIKYCDQLTYLPKLNHFGMFLGNTFSNRGVAVLVTVGILTFICICLKFTHLSVGYLDEVE